MTKYFCDRGEAPLAGAHCGTLVKPGYVGEKLICDSCWRQWGIIIHKFFEVTHR